MSNKATTFRLSDEVSAELETLRGLLGYATLNQTVEYVILNYRKTSDSLLAYRRELNAVNHELSTHKDRVTRFVQSFNDLTKP